MPPLNVNLGTPKGVIEIPDMEKQSDVSLDGGSDSSSNNDVHEHALSAVNCNEIQKADRTCFTNTGTASRRSDPASVLDAFDYGFPDFQIENISKALSRSALSFQVSFSQP